MGWPGHLLHPRDAYLPRATQHTGLAGSLAALAESQDRSVLPFLESTRAMEQRGSAVSLKDRR